MNINIEDLACSQNTLVYKHYIIRSLLLDFHSPTIDGWIDLLVVIENMSCRNFFLNSFISFLPIRICFFFYFLWKTYHSNCFRMESFECDCTSEYNSRVTCIGCNMRTRPLVTLSCAGCGACCAQNSRGNNNDTQKPPVQHTQYIYAAHGKN